MTDDIAVRRNPNDVMREQEEYIRQLEEENIYLQQLTQGAGVPGMAPPKTKDEQFLDRVLRQRIPAESTPSGCDLWMVRSEVVEVLSLLNINNKDYNRFIRDWMDIEDLSQGGGNKELVAAEQEEFFMALSLYRSRGDNEMKSYTERSSHFTNKTVSEQTVKMPQTDHRAGAGLFDVLRRKQ